jgi:hypothetical protein
VDAITRHAPGEPAPEAAVRLARAHGAELGARLRQTRRLGRPGPERTLVPTEGACCVELRPPPAREEARGRR